MLRRNDEDDELRSWREQHRLFVAKLLEYPSAASKLGELIKVGADREKMLLCLSSCTFDGFDLIKSAIRGRALALKQVADQLEQNARDIEGLLCNPLSYADTWKALLFPSVFPALPELEGTIPASQTFIRSLDGYSAKFRQEQRAMNSLHNHAGRLKERFYLNGLIRYTREVTGSFHDGLLADLLQAANDVAGHNRRFTEESLRKYRQRHAKELLRSARSVSNGKSVQGLQSPNTL